MALPKGKISKARKHSRRANWKLTVPGIVECPQCHQHAATASTMPVDAGARWPAQYDLILLYKGLAMLVSDACMVTSNYLENAV